MCFSPNTRVTNPILDMPEGVAKYLVTYPGELITCVCMGKVYPLHPSNCQIPYVSLALPCRVFDTMEDGIQHCEEQFLNIAISHGLCKSRETIMSLEDTLHSQTNIPSMMLGRAVDYKQVAESLKEFMQVLYTPSYFVFCIKDWEGRKANLNGGKALQCGMILCIQVSARSSYHVSGLPTIVSLACVRPCLRFEGKSLILG